MRTHTVSGLQLRSTNLAIVILVLLGTMISGQGFEHAIPVEELGRMTRLSDGFEFKLEAVPFPAKQAEGPKAVPLVCFSIDVPIEVAKTRLSVVFLEITSSAGQTLLATFLERKLHGSRASFVINAERRIAADCVLHFEYGQANDVDRLVKDYVVRLKGHLPK